MQGHAVHMQKASISQLAAACDAAAPTACKASGPCPAAASCLPHHTLLQACMSNSPMSMPAGTARGHCGQAARAASFCTQAARHKKHRLVVNKPHADPSPACCSAGCIKKQWQQEQQPGKRHNLPAVPAGAAPQRRRAAGCLPAGPGQQRRRHSLRCAARAATCGQVQAPRQTRANK